MEIQPASIDQLVAGRDGKWHMIPNDVGGVASSLRSIDSHIHLRYSEPGEYYVVYWKPEEGEQEDEYLITTANECDHRIVHRIEELVARRNDSRYDFAKESEKADQKSKADEATARTERQRDTAERMAHAIRKDYGGSTNRVFIGGGK